MSKQTEALKLALAALKRGETELRWKAISAAEKALAEQVPCKYPHCSYPCPDLPDCRDAEQPAQQEPVAWITKNGKGWLRWHKPEDSEKNKDSIPLYTAPASKPITQTTQDDYSNEPVAWASDVEFDSETEIIPAKQKGKLGTAGLRIPLYIKPPVTPPLTYEHIERIFRRYGGDMINCARAIEREHGIKGVA